MLGRTHDGPALGASARRGGVGGAGRGRRLRGERVQLSRPCSSMSKALRPCRRKFRAMLRGLRPSSACWWIARVIDRLTPTSALAMTQRRMSCAGAWRFSAMISARLRAVRSTTCCSRVCSALLPARRDCCSNQGKHLRDHQRPAQALQHPRGDQLAWASGQAAQQRHDPESRHSRHQHPPVPEQVSQPPAGDQPGRVRECVAADDQLQRTWSRVEVPHERPGQRH